VATPTDDLATASRPTKAIEHLLTGLDLLGTFIFAIEGGRAAEAAHLDLLGVMVLAFTTALGGGIVRDLLLGAAPPASIRDARYPVVAFTGGAFVIALHYSTRHIPQAPLIWLDAAGLALFAVAGAQKALSYGVSPLLAVLLGAITGSGGGVFRDLLLARVPNVLRADIYAIAAIVGAGVMVVCRKLGWRPASSALLGAAACFGLRMLSLSKHWNLPVLTP